MGSHLIVNDWSEFQVNIFSNDRDIRKMSKLLHDDDAADGDDDMAMTISRRFLRNKSRAKNIIVSITVTVSPKQRQKRVHLQCYNNIILNIYFVIPVYNYGLNEINQTFIIISETSFLHHIY